MKLFTSKEDDDANIKINDVTKVFFHKVTSKYGEKFSFYPRNKTAIKNEEDTHKKTIGKQIISQ